MDSEPDAESVRSSSRFWVVVEHPRTALIAALILAGLGVIAPRDFGYVLWAIAAGLLLRSAWEWAPIRTRILYDFRSPIVRQNSIPKVKPPPAELGLVDFELHMKKASEGLGRVLGKMTKQMTKNAARTERSTSRILRATGKSVERRRRVLAASGRVIRRHARHLARLEARYRGHVDAMVSNSRRLIETAFPGDVSEAIAASTAGLREAIVGNRASTVTYQNTIREERSLNVSQAVNGATDELIAVLDRIIEDADTLIAHGDWVADTAASR